MWTSVLAWLCPPCCDVVLLPSLGQGFLDSPPKAAELPSLATGGAQAPQRQPFPTPQGGAGERRLWGAQVWVFIGSISQWPRARWLGNEDTESRILAYPL